MDNIIRIKIEHVQRQENYNTHKETFWASFQNSFRKSQQEDKESNDAYHSIESYETSIENNFGKMISNSLITYCSRGIDIVDRRNYEEFYRRQYRNKGYYEDFRNTLYKNEPVYRDALNKSILASQIIIKTGDINYGSLSLGIIIEPIDKFLDIFDNNFDLMRIFFESYIPPAFIESIETDGNTYLGTYSDIQLSYYYDFPESLRRQQAKFPFNPSLENLRDDSKSNKIDRAKWLTGLVTSPMLFPFILALIILYFTYQKLETSNSIYLEQNKIIQQQKEEVIKGYKELLEQYKSDKKDTITVQVRK